MGQRRRGAQVLILHGVWLKSGPNPYEGQLALWAEDLRAFVNRRPSAELAGTAAPPWQTRLRSPCRDFHWCDSSRRSGQRFLHTLRCRPCTPGRCACVSGCAFRLSTLERPCPPGEHGTPACKRLWVTATLVRTPAHSGVDGCYKPCSSQHSL